MHGYTDAFDSVDIDPRPAKRQRPLNDADDGMRPYVAPVPGSSGLASEGDTTTEGPSKKTRKRPLSCGECRRLKLKCDRVFPCQSCCKRGCAEICPDGALTGGKGSRFILANTEQLHDKIKCMSERIRQLEEALHSLQSQLSPNEHPLLSQELLLIKKSPELFGVEQQLASSSADNHAGGRDCAVAMTGRAESVSSTREADPSASNRGDEDQFPEDFVQHSRSFPSPWSISQELNPSMRQRIRDMLPPLLEAQYLCEQARKYAFWQFNFDSETFLPNLMHSAYNSPLPALLPHRLGLFLMILAIGCKVDPKPRHGRQDAERYHHLARVALCEVPVMDDTSFDAVYALFFMEWYLLVFSDEKKALEYAWGIMGLMTKLALSIGLHRDGVRSKVIPEELDKRRTLLWDIVGMDARLSLMLRRPPSLNLRHIDAKLPDSNVGVDAHPSLLYHKWLHDFHLQCMLPVSDIVASPVEPIYADILEVDSQIRDFDVPIALRMIDQDGIAPSHLRALQQATIACTREIALLQLHRSYFTRAMNASEGFDVTTSKYAPSALAVYTSCCNLIWTVYTLYRWEPELSTRFSQFWSNCFSAAVALTFFTTQAGTCNLVPYALQELDKVLQLYQDAQDKAPFAAKALPSLEVLVTRARTVYMKRQTGAEIERDFTDEICRLGQRVGIVHQPGVTGMVLTGSEPSPFKHAHPSLVRCLEQASTENPCGPGVLKRMRRSVAQMADLDVPPARNPAGQFGADIHDANWMSWL
ncbi:fungal-specific transcription factor domain-containing protein [Cristinia sonorae]|uniref:Fungal-specific transcription factor domain-containing protein n=1 Tax=Cristinia sonorae TaxID=1940300 RepID=A0A8K0UUB4_9AGAR|nr:fungal-specific transcription factor domain-containing protein [Cristinia sonorae]